MSTVVRPPSASPAISGLAPLVADLLQRARQEAVTLETDADTQGRAALAEARRRLDADVSAAQEQGRAEGERLAAAERSAARRAARARLLAAQATAYEEVRHALRDTVRELLDADDNRARLRTVLRATLGGSPDLRDTPDGGVLAHCADGRTIDASATALADATLDRLDVGELWTAR